MLLKAYHRFFHSKRWPAESLHNHKKAIVLVSRRIVQYYRHGSGKNFKDGNYYPYIINYTTIAKQMGLQIIVAFRSFEQMA